MARFVDGRSIEGGVVATDVRDAHRADPATQAEHGVTYPRYWIDADEIYRVGEHA